MKRWAWNIFCAFSLLVFVGSVTLCVRSYLTSEEVERVSRSGPSHQVVLGIVCKRGGIAAYRIKWWIEGGVCGPSEWAYDRPALRLDEPGSTLSLDRVDVWFGRFELLHRIDAGGFYSTEKHAIAAPLWMFFPFGLPPVLWWRNWRNKRKGTGFPLEPAPPRRPVSDGTSLGQAE